MHDDDGNTGVREVKEAKRFDRKVSEEYRSNEQLLIEPIHWEKFNTFKPIPHSYGYVVQSLGDLKGKRVLEAGCGTGIFSVILLKRGAQYVESFDISEKSIEIARRRAEVNRVADRVNFTVNSFYEIEYQKNSFDFVVGMNILHHVDIDRIVEKVYMLLKPGGIAYFAEPFGNELWLERLRLLVPVKVNEEDKTHYDEQLKYTDVQKFKSHFENVACLEFHLFSRLDRVIRNKWILKRIAQWDALLLKGFPFLRRYARKIVVIAKK